MPDTDNTDSELDKLLDATWAYGVDWTEHKDKSEHDNEVSLYAAQIKSEMKAKLKTAITNLIAQEANKATDRLIHEVIGQSKEVRSYIDGTPVEFQAVPVSVLNTYLTKDSDIQSSDVYQDDTYLRGGNNDDSK